MDRHGRDGRRHGETFGRTARTLVIFSLGLAALFGTGVAVGAAVGPDGPGEPAPVDDHEDHP